MSNSVKRRRKPAQNGVQAVFTQANDWKGRAQVLLSVVAIVAGTVSWTYSTKAFESLGIGNLIGWNPSASALLLPLSIPLLIGGVGLCTYYLAMRRTWRARNRIESALLELEMLVGQKNGKSAPVFDGAAVPHLKVRRKLRFDLLSKTLAIALVEGIILVVIYSGLVQEYVSNVNMQNWVQSNFSPGIYLLNYYMVLILAGLLGMLIFRLLPRKLQPEEVRKSTTKIRLQPE